MLLDKIRELEQQVEKRAYRQRFDPVTHEPILPGVKGLSHILDIYNNSSSEYKDYGELESLKPTTIKNHQSWKLWNTDDISQLPATTGDKAFRAKAPQIREVAPNTVSDLHALDNLSLEGVTGKDAYRQPIVKNVVAPKTWETPKEVLYNRAAFEENIKHKPLPRKAAENYLKADEQFNNLVNKFKNGENIFDPKTMSIKTQVPKIKEVATPFTNYELEKLDNLALEQELGKLINFGDQLSAHWQVQQDITKEQILKKMDENIAKAKAEQALAEAAKSPFRKHMDKHFGKYLAGAGIAMAGTGLYNYYKKNKEKTAAFIRKF